MIRRGPRPVAKLVAYSPELEPRAPGDLKGKIWMSDDFQEPLEELADEFGIGS